MKKNSVKFTKKQILHQLWKFFLVILGTFVLAFGSGVFLVPFQIVSGGITGIGILLNSFIPVDISAYIFTWGLFFVGLLLLGVKFSLSTLISTILYPAMLSVFLRTGISEQVVKLLIESQGNVKDFVWNVNGFIENIESLHISQGTILIAGIIGGACVGIGCSLTFLGGGSTGGLDILTFIINKYFGVKTSVSFFTIDSIIVGSGIIFNLVQGSAFKFSAGLVGIISAFICSLMVEVVYAGKEKAYNVDIISDKYQEFIKYSIETLDRSATIFDVVGGYTDENKKMVRITFNRREYIKIKDGIALIDPDAFVTFTQTILVGGEGFSQIQYSNNNTIKNIRKIIKEKKNEK